MPFRAFAQAIGRNLGLLKPPASASPKTRPGHFGFLGLFVAADNPASNTLTRQRLGWAPEHPGLIADLDDGHYFA